MEFMRKNYSLDLLIHRKKLVSCSLIESLGANVFVDPKNAIVDVAVWDEIVVGWVLWRDELRSVIDASLKLLATEIQRSTKSS